MIRSQGIGKRHLMDKTCRHDWHYITNVDIFYCAKCALTYKVERVNRGNIDNSNTRQEGNRLDIGA